MFSTRETLLILNTVPGMNAHIVRMLMEQFGDVTDIVRPETLDLMAQHTSCGKRLVERITHSLAMFDPHRECDALTEQSCTVISFLDAAYPRLLREIYDPPVVLYVKGTIRGDEECISVVGSRSASLYGMTMARAIAADLAGYDITVISGLAKGIDAAAHDGALAGGGRTIAVLGCGVDVIYPTENSALYKRVCEQGAVISEYPLGTVPHPYHFPRRNRIISGMSKGTVVVEAAQRSGSLITARLALDEGREVYSVPGKADALRSQGTNNLIREGATLVMGADDIVRDLFPERCAVRYRHRMPCDTTGRRETPQPQRVPDELLVALCAAKPRTIDELSEASALDMSRLYAELLQLELAHRLERTAGGLYVAHHN